MWDTIEGFDDITHFLADVSFFHDSCIKQLTYVSGSYVLPDLSMNAANDLRKLNVVIQRQCATMTTIELEFSGLIKLNLEPKDPKHYTSEILGITMYYDGDYIVLSDLESTKADNKQYDGFYVCAECVRWRILSDDT